MKNTQRLVYTALCAGLITIMTAYICHIPVGVHGGYVHFGDAIIYIAASILPTQYAVFAAGIGGGLADLFTAPIWMPATIIIKVLIALPFTSKKDKILCKHNMVAVIIGSVITIVGYALAEAILFGNYLISVVGILPNIIQAVGSGIFYMFIGAAIDKSGHRLKRI